MPRVTVLLTCYNHLRYLPEAYRSIAEQTFTDWEILAIDDGSTDGSREWLLQQDRVTCIFNERNLGTYASLNVGVRAANGEFIAILNDDDLWGPEKLDRQVALLDGNPALGLVHTGGWFIDGEGGRVEGTPLGFAFPTEGEGDLSLRLAYSNTIITSSALLRRRCFEEVGVFNEAYFGSGDWEMWIRIAERWKVGFVEAPLTFYRVHSANASNRKSRIWEDDERLRRWLIPRLDGYQSRYTPDEVRRLKAHNFAALGTVLILNGQATEGRRLLAASLKEDPKRWKTAARYLASYLPESTFRRLG